MIVEGEHCCCRVNLIHILQGGVGGWLEALQSFGVFVLMSKTAPPARAGQTQAGGLGGRQHQILLQYGAEQDLGFLDHTLKLLSQV